LTEENVQHHYVHQASNQLLQLDHVYPPVILPNSSPLAGILALHTTLTNTWPPFFVLTALHVQLALNTIQQLTNVLTALHVQLALNTIQQPTHVYQPRIGPDKAPEIMA
jgi:hypothetical protein